jgi:hypothetical protein
MQLDYSYSRQSHNDVYLASLCVSTPADRWLTLHCHGRGRRFEPRRPRILFSAAKGAGINQAR